MASLLPSITNVNGKQLPYWYTWTSMVILVNTKTILLVCGESDNMPVLCQLVVMEGMFGPTLHAYVANVLWSTKMAMK